MLFNKEDFKKFYQPNEQPRILEVPAMTYITISGTGDPNGEEFASATGALYAVSYAIKMSYKKSDPPEGYYDYKVFPMEGDWDLVDKSKPSTDKSNFSYTIMIRQPDFVTKELFDYFLKETKKKKGNDKLDLLEFEERSDGLCCQMLHIGPYDTEPKSFEKMQNYCESQGYQRLLKTHKEIYLSDPRKADPAKMKTILRFRVAKKENQ